MMHVFIHADITGYESFAVLFRHCYIWHLCRRIL